MNSRKTMGLALIQKRIKLHCYSYRTENILKFKFNLNSRQKFEPGLGFEPRTSRFRFELFS